MQKTVHIYVTILHMFVAYKLINTR